MSQEGDDLENGGHPDSRRGFSMETRMTLMERDLQGQSRSITFLIQKNAERDVQAAEAKVRDEQRDADLATIKSLGKWALGGIGIVALTQIVNFALGGGFKLPGV